MESGYTYPGRSLNKGEVMRNQSYCTNPDSVGVKFKEVSRCYSTVGYELIERWEVSQKQEGRNVKKMNDYMVY